jgi:uncharacterized protein (TIGR02687 family)
MGGKVVGKDELMENRIAQALTRLFDRHRIIFWHDTKQELRDDFERLDLASAEKIELNNNEFAVKHRILREQPHQKFLLYRAGQPPTDLHNWLLDVQLAHGEFRTDQVGLWLSELDLGLEFADVVSAHTEFYQAAKRQDALKKLLRGDDTKGAIRLKMLAVCSGAEPRLDSILENLLSELAEERDDKIRLIDRCELDAFLWQQVERVYGYRSETPGIVDFGIELFKSCYAMETNGPVRLTGDALVFLKRWKDSRLFEASFETLSNRYSEALGIEQDLSKRDFRELIELDYFRLIDQKIIRDLVKAVEARTVSSGDVTLWVRQRRQGHWYEDFKHLYETVDYASQFITTLVEANLDMESMADGIRRYCQSWYRLDQLYRKFIFHLRQSGQTSLLSSLSEQIENLYSNNYLLKVNNNWQGVVDAASRWEAPPTPLQKTFYQTWVKKPFLDRDKKVCVIISDALRYEIGDELVSLIRQEDRYEAELDSALAMLPSYTQLGMAALLPNTELALRDGKDATVNVDGFSSQGTANRIKILERTLADRATALKAEELMGMSREDSRTLFRDHDVVYIYHNHIDAVGDKRDTEERVFEAAEETCQELIRLVKKLTGANASNLIVTADHGFIYQHRPIEESDFSACEASGDEILYQNRRFVLGRGLKPSPGLRQFSAAELGLAGDIEVQIPKSINRLRLKGSGSRFVHGGAALQEVIIPVVKINKKRQSDISAVDVDILRGTNSTITSGQLAVVLYQAQPATDKVQPRTLRAGIYTQAGDLISDAHDLAFDLISENPRERELQVRFVLTSKADSANGQEVILRLDEKITGTSHYREYKSIRYLMRRSFTSDFDF